MRLPCLLVAAFFAFGGSSPALLSPAPAAAAGNDATEGCLNQTLTSGTWRVRVTSVGHAHRTSPYSDVGTAGWAVSIQWTNAGPHATPVPLTTGAVDWQLYFPSGANLGAFDSDASTELSRAGTGVLQPGEDQTGISEFFDQPFPPAVTRKGVFKFWYRNDPQYFAKPVKFVISGAPYISTHFTQLRFKLNCTK